MPRRAAPESSVNLDWRRLKPVVFESDDWGVCGWAPDEQAHRVLADTPAWRGPLGRRFGRSTLESADDVERLTSTLLEFRGADGFPPVWQANTVLAAPDYARLMPPLFEVERLPLIFLPETPSRWGRPGLWDQVKRAREAGVWWNELHGLHRIPAQAWLTALRRGAADARRAHEHQCFVCEAVTGAGEYDPKEPRELRTADLETAVERFRTLFGRSAESISPPDHRWDGSLEADAERLGVTVLQGKSDQAGRAFAGLRRRLDPLRWPDIEGRRVRMPPRIVFDPRGDGGDGPPIGEVHRAVRASWNRGVPAVIGVHRSHVASLDPSLAELGRAALRDLLELLVGDGAVFLSDAEVAGLARSGWSVRPIGDRGALLRFYGLARDPVRYVVPDGVGRAVVKDARGDDNARIQVEGGELRAQLDAGEYLLEWRRD